MSSSASNIAVVALEVGGHPREYLLFRPASAPAQNAALVIELHGSGLDPWQQIRASSLTALADTHGFMLAAPRALLPLRLFEHWPVGTAWHLPGVPMVNQLEAINEGPDEQAFIEAMIDDLQQRCAHDPARVYLVGYSGGARLASRLAHTLPGRFAAMAMVSGLRDPGVPPGGHLPPLISFHGRRDPINPFDGEAGGRWNAGVDATAEALAALRGCHPTPEIDRFSPGSTRQTYSDANAQPQLIQYVVDEGLHTWPGSRDPEHLRMLGPDVAALDASRLIWDFFLPRTLHRPGRL